MKQEISDLYGRRATIINNISGHGFSVGERVLLKKPSESIRFQDEIDGESLVGWNEKEDWWLDPQEISLDDVVVVSKGDLNELYEAFHYRSDKTMTDQIRSFLKKYHK